MMLFLALLAAFSLDTVAGYQLPDEWAKAKILSGLTVDETGRLWCLDPFANRILTWNPRKGTINNLDIGMPEKRVRPIGFWLKDAKLYLTYAPLPYLFIHDTLGCPLDTLLLDTAGCSVYPVAYPLVRPDGGFWIYTDRWTPELGYDYWLHYYAPDGRYVKSFFPMSNYAVEANLLRFLGMLAHPCSMDSSGGIWCCEPCSYLIWHFSSSGKFLGTIGVPPVGYKLPAPISASKAYGNDEDVRKAYEDWSVNSDIFTDVYLGGGLILSCFVRRDSMGARKNYTQFYRVDGTFLGTAELSPDAIDDSGNIYLLERDSLIILRIKG